MKHPEEIILKNNFENLDGLFMRVIVRSCNPIENSDCASAEEVDEWLAVHEFYFFSKLNFINYDEVREPGNHIESYFESMNSEHIQRQNPR